MTDTEKKSTHTESAKDVKPADQSSNKKKEQHNVKAGTQTKNNSGKSSSSNARVFILIFFIVIATTGGLYLLWENQQQNLFKNKISTQRTDQEIEELKNQLLEAKLEDEKRIKLIHSEQENFRNTLVNIIRDKQNLRNDWLMAEAEYLIQLANHRLLLEKDVVTAIVALKAADARLAEVADPVLLKIRKILSKDLQTLNNIATVDLAGLSITLSALSNNIPNLPLRTPDPQTHKITQADKKQTSSEVKSLADLPAAVWQDLRSLIVIRNHEKPLEPLLAPNQHFFLVQNIALLLEQSRLALLHGHNEIYQERLQTAEKWIKQYFDAEHNITRNMLASINELQKFDIDPDLPDISATFSAVKKYRTQGTLPETPIVKVE